MYDKFNELALKSDKEECKELEFCCFLNDYPIKDFNEIMDMVQQLSPKYTHVTVFINVDEIEPIIFNQLNNYCNSFLKKIPENVMIYYRGIPCQFLNYNLTTDNQAFPIHLTLYSYKDVEDLLKLKAFTTALIFKINDQNISDLIKGYWILYNKKWKADYATFKIYNKSTSFTEHMKSELEQFLTDIFNREDYRWDDKKDCLIFNKDTVILPLKAVRGIEKNISQYKKALQYSFILRTKDGKMFQQEDKKHEIIKDDLIKAIQGQETPLHFYCDRCKNCQLSKYCCESSDNIINPDNVDWFSCDEMKYWEFIQQIAQKTLKHEIVKGYYKA